MSARTRIALAAAVAALSLAVAVAPASAGKNGPNNDNAKKCQSYLDWVDANGSAFQSSTDCTAYAAKGGTLHPASAAPCLGIGYQMKATANGDPFTTADACASYLTANPGQLVSCTRVGTSGNDVLGNAGWGEVVCGFGGNDVVNGVDTNAVFYGGAGDDTTTSGVGCGGTYIGGDGNDRTLYVSCGSGTFNGGAGDDTADGVINQGTFNGEAGNDTAIDVRFSTYDGGPGDDRLCRDIDNYGDLDSGIFLNVEFDTCLS